MLGKGKFFSRYCSQLWHNRKFRYLAIGAWNTLAGYAIFAGLYVLLSSFVGYLFVAGISHVFAVTQSFVTQRQIVFRSAGSWKGEYLRFHIAHLGSFGIGLGALALMVEIFNAPPLFAQGVITVLIVAFSYFMHQYFTFRKAKVD